MSFSEEDVRRCRESALLPETEEHTIVLLERISHHRLNFDLSALRSKHSPKTQTKIIGNSVLSDLLWQNGTSSSAIAQDATRLVPSAERESSGTRLGSLENPLQKHAQKSRKPERSPSISIRSRQTTKSQKLRQDVTEKKVQNYKLKDEATNWKVGCVTTRFPEQKYVPNRKREHQSIGRSNKRMCYLTVSPEAIGSTICLSNANRSISEVPGLASPPVKIHVDPQLMNISNSDENYSERKLSFSDNKIHLVEDGDTKQSDVVHEDSAETKPKESNSEESLMKPSLPSNFPQKSMPSKNEQGNSYNISDEEIAAMQERIRVLESIVVSQIQEQQQQFQQREMRRNESGANRGKYRSANASRGHTPKRLGTRTNNSTIPSKREQVNDVETPNPSLNNNVHNTLIPPFPVSVSKEFSSISLIDSIAENILGTSCYLRRH